MEESNFDRYALIPIFLILLILVGFRTYDMGKSATKANVVYKNVYVYETPNIFLHKSFSLLALCTGYTKGYESTGKHPGDIGYGLTSSGKYVKQGYVAADIDVFPYGSLIYIDGMGVYQVEDTGSAIKGNHIDIYFDDVNEALRFGRQRRNVILLRRGY